MTRPDRTNGHRAGVASTGTAAARARGATDLTASTHKP